MENFTKRKNQMTPILPKEVISLCELANRSGIEVNTIPISHYHVIIRFQQPWIISKVTIHKGKIIEILSPLSILQKLNPVTEIKRPPLQHGNSAAMLR